MVGHAADEPPAGRAPVRRRWWLALAVLLAVLALLSIAATVLVVMARVGASAVVVLAVLRSHLSAPEIGYACPCALATVGSCWSGQRRLEPWAPPSFSFRWSWWPCSPPSPWLVGWLH
jgi:hypothetical protein